jgi:outer membrane cobalamin receptor
VCFDWPDASAWHARRRHPHFISTLALLLTGGAAALCAGGARSWAGEAPTYETVVVAPPAVVETAREDRAAASSVIAEDRAPRAVESVPQLLSEQSGVTVTRLGGMGSTATISLRGSTSNQVLVYVDGVPFNTVTGGGVDVGAIPMGDVERIEIYRGTSPIVFGASAIGGVVSITTLVPRENRAELEIGGGSFATYYGGARGAWNRGRLHLYGGAHLMSSEGDFPYIDSKGTKRDTSDDEKAWRRNNDLRQLDGTARALVDLPGERRLSVSALFFSRGQGLPGPGTLAAPDARLGTLRTTGIVAFQSGQDLGPGGRLRATAYGNYQLTHFADPSAQISASPTEAHDSTITAGGTLDGKRAVRPWLVLSFVLDGRFDRFTPSDDFPNAGTASPGTRLFGAAGIDSDYWLAPIRFDIIASLRIEATHDESSGRDNFGVFLPTSRPVNHVLPIARLSLLKQLGDWVSLAANGGHYARLPTLIELYGNTGYLQGNPALVPESGFNADVGPRLKWRRGTSAITWSTAGFASLVSDLIQYQYGGGRARARNLGSARILGVESSATVEIGPHARLLASATFTDARDTSVVEAQNGKQLPLRPRYRFYARPEWRAVRLGARTSLGFFADVDATAGNYLDPSNLERVPARLLFGAGLHADLPGDFRLRASGQNLANSPISDLANYPLPGREIYLTLSWSSDNNQPKD